MTGEAWVIAAGCATYANGAWEPLDQVPHEIDAVVRCFESLGYRRALADVSLDPRKEPFLGALREWCRQRSASDRVVVYYTGHGERLTDRHALIFHDSTDDAESGVPAEELVRKVLSGTPLQQVLIVLDTCFAGQGIQDAQRLANVVSERKDAREPMHVYLMAAATPVQVARQTRFAGAFIAALLNEDGRTDPSLAEFVHPDKVLERVNREMQGQAARGAAMVVSGEPRLIPNLHRRRALDVYRNELRSHWIERVRGAERQDGPWYFGGRDAARRALCEWLAAPSSQGRARWITGGPGSGKSALVAWLVVTSDPQARERPDARAALAAADPRAVPRAGAITCAIHAAGKSLAQVVVQVALSGGFDDVANLALQSPSPAAATQLLGRIVESGRRLALVVDALDESPEAASITRELLAPLTGIAHVWLVVAARPPRIGPAGPAFPDLGPNVDVIDLDDARWSDPNDLARYVRERLLAAADPEASTPYRDDPERASRIAQAVAQRAQRNFLIARLVVRDLLARTDAIDTAAPGWQAQFPAGVDAALDRDLEQFDRMPLGARTRQAVIDLMAPLAFARGDGVPEDAWRAIASHAAHEEFLPRDLRALLERAPYYFVATPGRRGPTYRLFHQALAQYLGERRAEDAMQRAYAAVLGGSVRRLPDGRRDWQAADPYVLAHLAEHAGAAGELDDLLDDPAYLLHAAPAGLVRSIDARVRPGSQPIAHCIELVAHRLAGEPPEERAAYLSLAATQLGLDEVHARFDALAARASWRLRWARWSSVPAHRVVASHAGLAAIAVGRHGGRSVVASGGAGRWPVMLWDGDTGERWATVAADDASPVRALAWVDAPEPLVVAGTDAGTSWAVGLDGAVRWRAQGSAKKVRALAAADVHDATLVWCAHEDGHVDVRDAHTGELVRTIVNAHGASAIAVTSLDGEPGAAIGDWSGGVTTHGLRGGEARRFELFTYATRRLCAGVRDDRPVVLAGDNSGRVVVMDPAGRRPPVPIELGEESAATAIAIARLGGRPAVVVGTSTGQLRCFELAGRRELASFPAGSAYPVDAVGAADTTAADDAGETRAIVHVATRDDTVRRWDVGAMLSAPARARTTAASTVIEDVDCGEWNGMGAIVAACDGRDAFVLRRDDGAQLAAWTSGRDERAVSRVALAATRAGPRLAMADARGGLRVWDGAAAPVLVPDAGASERAEGPNRAAVGERIVRLRAYRLADACCAAMLQLDGTLRVFTLEPQPSELRRCASEATALEILADGADTMLVTGTARSAVAVRDPVSLQIGPAIGFETRRERARVLALAARSHEGVGRLAVAFDDGVTWVVARSGERYGPFETSPGFATAVALGAVRDVPVIAIGSVHGEVVVSELERAAVRCRVHLANVSSLAMPGDGQLVVGCLSGLYLLDLC